MLKLRIRVSVFERACPCCGSTDVRRSRSSRPATALTRFLMLFLARVPFVCESCDYRFLALWAPYARRRYQLYPLQAGDPQDGHLQASEQEHFAYSGQPLTEGDRPPAR